MSESEMWTGIDSRRCCHATSAARHVGRNNTGCVYRPAPPGDKSPGYEQRWLKASFRKPRLRGAAASPELQLRAGPVMTARRTGHVRAGPVMTARRAEHV